MPRTCGKGPGRTLAPPQSTDTRASANRARECCVLDRMSARARQRAYTRDTGSMHASVLRACMLTTASRGACACACMARAKASGRSCTCHAARLCATCTRQPQAKCIVHRVVGAGTWQRPFLHLQPLKRFGHEGGHPQYLRLAHQHQAARTHAHARMRTRTHACARMNARTRHRASRRLACMVPQFCMPRLVSHVASYRTLHICTRCRIGTVQNCKPRWIAAHLSQNETALMHEQSSPHGPGCEQQLVLVGSSVPFT